VLPTATTSRAYELLRGDVLAGEFTPGALLLETTLAERYGISRTPVREALGRLEQDGLLERATRGYRVCSGTEQDVLDLYEARIALEAEAAAGAAARRTDLDLARLLHLHAVTGEQTDPVEIRKLNSDWHLAVWQASHNRTIVALLTRLTAQLRIYDRGPHETAEDLGKTRLEHTQVLAGIAARDPDVARTHLARHLARSRELRLAQFARSDPRVLQHENDGAGYRQSPGHPLQPGRDGEGLR
jgi:DNA-binding GntR family transcriptional regulator